MPRSTSDSPPVLSYACAAARPLSTSITGAVAAIHFVVYGIVFFMFLGQSMDGFDRPVPPTIGRDITKVAFHILSLPLVAPLLWLKVTGLGMASWLVFIANSVCWGLAIQLLARLLRRLRTN